MQFHFNTRSSVFSDEVSILKPIYLYKNFKSSIKNFIVSEFRFDSHLSRDSLEQILIYKYINLYNKKYDIYLSKTFKINFIF